MNAASPTFSILVAVYNAGEYLDGCVKSVLAQSYPHWELILVDDGSTDDSLSKCLAYATQEKRIKVVHQENQGLPCARNTGIANATGDYFLFLDNDDTIISDALDEIKSLVVHSPDIQVFHFPCILNYGGNKVPVIESFYAQLAGKCLSGEEAFRVLFANPKTRCSNWQSWRNVIKRAYWISKGYCYRKGVFHEDIDFNPQLILEANRIQFAARPYLEYLLLRDGAMSAKFRPSRIVDLFDILEHWYNYFEYRKVPADLEIGFKSLVANNVLSAVLAIPSMPRESQEELYVMAEKVKKKLLTVDRPWMSAVVKCSMMRCFGVKMTAKAYNLMRKLVHR